MAADTVQPFLVVDSDDKDLWHRIDTPEYQAFLTWARSEGIAPENARRCEVFDARDGKPPCAVLTMYELNADGVKIWDEATNDAATYTDIVTLSSLPPSREV